MSEVAPPPPRAWPQRLHAALMPDYNRAATVYWWLATPAGGLLLLACLVQLALLPAADVLPVVLGLAFAVAAGLFPVRIPGTRISFGIVELISFLVLLLQGPAAAAVLAATEAGVGAFRTSKRWTSRLGSPAMATLAMFAAGSALTGGQRALAARGYTGEVPLLALALGVGLLYFILSATLIGATARLRRGQHLLHMSDVLGAFRWVGLAYAGSAVFATLLYLVYLQAGADVLWVVVVLVLLLLTALQLFYRQQEAQQAMRSALAGIAQREEAMRQREVETRTRHERELALSERRFHGAFMQAAIGMVLLDLEGRIIESNDALCRLLGRDAEDLMGMGFTALLHADDRQAFLTHLAPARDVHFEAFELVLRLLDAGGRTRRVRVHCSFFSGPATHGADKPGKPCLMLQALAMQPPEGDAE